MLKHKSKSKIEKHPPQADQFSTGKHNIKKIVKAGLFLTLGVLAFLSYSLYTRASIPDFVNYQGKLMDSTGNPITAPTTIQFSLYSHITNGTPTDTPSQVGPLLWTETYDQGSGNCQQITPGTDGIFAQHLGDCVPFPAYLDFTQEYYLGVKIGADTEATPRVPLSTHPYAFTAKRLNVGAGNLYIINTDSTGDVIINTARGMRINGSNTTFPGAVYQADYSANYTNRSLVDKEYVDNQLMWEINPADDGNPGRMISPKNNSVRQIFVEENSNSYTQFKVKNTNDAGNIAGAIIELKGSGADYTNNMYIGKYGASFWIPELQDNGAVLTDKNLVIGTASGAHEIHFITGDSYTNLQPVVVADNKGFRYTSDLSATFVDRTLVDKAYVDNLVNSSVTASNGLTKTGNDIQLGGLLTEDTFINKSGHSMRFNGDGFFQTQVFLAGQPYYTHAQQNIDSLNFMLQRNNGGLRNSFNITPTAMTFRDQLNSRGVEYYADYSANYTNRSLVDKEYVDNAILAGSSNIYTTDGTLTGNRTVSLNGNSLKFVANNNGELSFASSDTNNYNSGLYIRPDKIFGNIKNINSNHKVNFGMADGESIMMEFSHTSNDYSRIEASEANGLLITDRIGHKGIDYAYDYSANYTNRTLVDKGYVDNLVNNGVTVSNGLTEVGNDIQLGGTLTHSTWIETSKNETLSIGNQNGTFSRVGFGELEVHNDPSGAFTVYGQDYIDFKHETSTNMSKLSYENRDSILVSASGVFKGITYGQDYSANYTNRSLVDKEYVDNAVAGGGASSWTKTGTNLSPTTAGDDVLLNSGETLTISDLISGSITFAGTGGLISQDNVNLFWDDVNNRLGVGTMSPLTAIHINSNDVNTSAILTLENTAGDIQMFRTDATPENDVTGSIGDLAIDGTNGVIYIKNTGNVTNTGWTKILTAETIGIDDLTDGQNDSTNNNLFLGQAGFTGTFYNNYNTVLGLAAFDNPNTDNSVSYWGDWNTAIGNSALTNNTTGYANTAVGFNSLRDNTSGLQNTAIGVNVLQSNTTGRNNTATGRFSMNNNFSGYNNVAYGIGSLRNNSSGNRNTAIGAYALANNTSNHGNVAIGFQAGNVIADGTTHNQTGQLNVFVGMNTKALTDGDQNEIVIGYNTIGAGSNTVTLGNDIITTTLLKGNIGIGTTTPNSLLDVRGDAIFNDDGGDNDFRIEGDNNANLFFVDGGNDRVGIGTSTPAYKVDISGGALMLDDMGGAPTASQGYAGIYTVAGELFAFDDSGNSTQISPHNNNGLWWYNSTNAKTGKTIQIEMELLTKELNKMLGGGYITENGEKIDEGENTISKLSLQTNQNISTLEELQESIDSNLVVINQSLTDLEKAVIKNNKKIKSIKDNTEQINTNTETLATLSENINSLTKLTTNLTTTIEDHETRIAQIETILEAGGVDLENLNNNQDNNSTAEFTLTDEMQTLSDNLTMIKKEGKDIKFTLDGDLVVKELEAERVNTKEIVLENKSVGVATIKAGETEAVVETTIVSKDNSRIMLTPHNTVVTAIKKIKDGKSFTIKIAEEQEEDLKVDWFIIQEDK